MKRTLFALPLLLAACAINTVPPRPSDQSAIVPPATSVPEFTISATFMPAPSSAPVSLAPTTLKLAMILDGDDGKNGKKIGCGDSLVFVEKQVPHTVATLTAAMTELLATKQSVVGSMSASNPLSRSTLSLVGATVAPDGTATVKIQGTIAIAGVCESPRIEAQVEETALAVPGVTKVIVELNGSATTWNCTFDESGLPPCDTPPNA